jgi:hypothetical protein
LRIACQEKEKEEPERRLILAAAMETGQHYGQIPPWQGRLGKGNTTSSTAAIGSHLFTLQQNHDFDFFFQRH